MQHLDLFVTEFGNTSLNREPTGSYSHFVLSAVLIEEAKLAQAWQLRESISHRNFQGHPISSTRIPDDEPGFQVRLDILQELRQLGFMGLSLVINKSKVAGEGLEQNAIFYKCFNRIFLKQFPKNFTSFSIHADQIGWPEFRFSLQHYINTKVIQRDLFTPDRTYRLVEDRQAEPLVQLADFITGCLGKIYCTSHSHEKAASLFDLLHDRSFVDFFPFEKTDFAVSIPEREQEKNELISQIAAASAAKPWPDPIVCRTKPRRFYNTCTSCSVPHRIGWWRNTKSSRN